MVMLQLRSDMKNDTCNHEIGLLAQNIDNFQGSKTNIIIGSFYVIV
jgi:hypothetical protein